jgi:hypothetical protein
MFIKLKQEIELEHQFCYLRVQWRDRGVRGYVREFYC